MPGVFFGAWLSKAAHFLFREVIEMKHDKENSYINALFFSSTIFFMIYFAINMDNLFSESLWNNILTVPIWIVMSFFGGGLLILLPTALIYYLLENKFSGFHDFSARSKKIIVCIAMLAIWIILALVVTYW